MVELRWFGGLSVAETAAILDVSTRTVERGWRAAAAWLRTRIEDES
ncbi:MAG: ECF-type sigma factor [Planctomycetota bacterium JB042]